MKLKNLACIASLLVASLSGANAATTLTAWTFDNNAVGLNASPVASTGLGSASALGLTSSTYNNTNSVSNPDVYAAPTGTSSGGANAWRVRASSTAGGSHGNGWSTNAPIGTQGAQFSGSTFGYNKVKVTFDVYATSDAEANLQVQYSTDVAGTNWCNATITSAGSDTIGNNTTSANTVTGSYVTLVSGWNNQITVDLSGVSAVDNSTNFSIRLVNASTCADCVDTTGAVYNNKTGSWTFDNVVFTGTGLDTIVEWTFDSYPSASTIVTNPVPEIGGATAGKATSIGFNNGYTYAGGNGTGSTDASDINNTGGSSSGSAGPNAWRVRGAILATGVAGIGWNYNAPIGTQGAEYDASTAGYSNIVVNFDLYFTSAAEARACVLYTTDGWATTNVANSLAYAPNPSYIQTNLPVGSGGSANTVTGTYFVAPNSQGFYNNIIVDFTGIPGVDNNPLFGFKVVNAATGSGDCLNLSGTAYNNSSGNWRFDNVTVAGTAGTPPPAIAFDPNATVDHAFTNTFTDNPAWRAAIAGVYVNGQPLTNTAYTVTAGKIVFTPANSSLLQASGLLNISILSVGFGTAKVAQPIVPGVATKLAFTKQATGPSASTGTLVVNPVLLVSDQYGNGTTNPYYNVTVSAAVSNSVAWILGGDTNQTAVNGLIVFSNLTATVVGGTNYPGAAITFTVTGYSPLTVTNSPAFNIAAAPATNFTRGDLAVLQLDKSANNTTFSIIELKPSAAGQTNAFNIVPISATGPNALRMSSAGTCGRLSLNDDGTLLCFAAFVDGSSATPDETFNLNRAAVGLNYTNQVSIGFTYTSTSLGGSQARSCTELLDTYGSVHWIVDDKGGLYDGNTNSGTITQPNLNAYNNVVVKNFAGVPYVETQKAVGPSLPVLYNLGLDTDTGLFDITPYTPGLTTDANATDFYLISTNGGTSYDVLYIMDSVSTNGIITKYSLVSGTWTANGSYTNRTGGDSLFATTNGNGGVYLYFTTAPASGPNSVVRITDAAGWNGSLNIISTNVIYTASGNAYLKGITFVPQQNANVTELTPPPILTAQSTAFPGSATFAVTNSPDVPAWRGGITGITVNGSALPTAAYATNSAGKIVFTPSASSGLLTTSGPKTIVISSTGFSTNSVVQILIGNATQLVMVTEPSATNTAGGTLATQPVLYIEDAYGDVVNTNNSTVVTATVGTGTGPLTGTLTATAVNGVVTFSGLKSPTLVQTGLLLTFTATGLSSAVDATSVTITPASPSKLVMGTEPSTTVAAGATFSTAPAVYIEDTYGNVVTTANSNVVATVGTGTGPLTGIRTNAAVAGIATFTTLGAPTLAQTGLKLTFTNAVLTSAADATSITVTAAAASKLGITTQPTAPVGNGGALGTQPVVVVQDQYGNTITSATSNIVASVGVGTWALGGTTTKAAVSGSSAFTGLTAFSTNSVMGATIVFNAGSLTSATSSPFNIPSPIKSVLGGAKLTGGKLSFAFTNITGLSFSVLATNNLTAPQSTWPVVGTAVEGPAGIYNYTNTAATNANLFYILRQP
jgi:hypothetical protein